MNATLFDEETDDSPEAHSRRALKKWAGDCTSGQRTGTPALTDCERRVLLALRSLNYEVAADNRYQRLIRKAAS
jgi:hypothetical protein